MKKFAQRPYHAMSSSASLLHLQTSEKGLSDFDASGRINAFGKNVLPTQKKTSGIRLFLQQFHNPLIYVVVFAAIASFSIGRAVDAFFILFVIFLNATVGFIQENKAEKSLEKLHASIKQYVRVIRSGGKKKVLSEDIAVGDVVDLIAGDRISADGRLIIATNCYVNESTLTGEWHDVEKTVDIIADDVAISDQKNMVFAGTNVTQGHAVYVVTATAMDSEIGKISHFVQSAKQTKTPLQKKFAHLSTVIGTVIFVVIMAFSILGIWRGQTVEDIFISATALTVSAIPEGLLPAVTIILIFGMRRLARHHALVRKLNASETMGAVTTICTDKTGTLTKGEMGVSHILTGANELLDFDHSSITTHATHKDFTGHVKALTIASVVNDAYVENLQDELSQSIVHGRPTDRALLMAAVQVGIDVDAFRREYPLIDQEFFRSESKYAVRIHQWGKDKIKIMVLGAPEQVLTMVSFIDVHGVRMPFNSTEGNRLKETFEDLTQRGLRVLACSERVLTNETYHRLSQKERCEAMSLVGFVALKDPLRHDVEESLHIAERAGIRLVVITGDHAVTARSVMAELGHNVSDQGICLGAEIDRMSDDQLRERVKYTKIFARVLPEHKIRIVRALQNNGEVVVMVGDGINDAPAIKASDVGISIGEGADIAKEVSDIVLLDSGFTTIIKAVEQGRVIYENIRRALIYLVADDFSEIFIFFTAMIFGWPLPLLPLQVLWINMIEDSFPNIALTTEYDSKKLMNEPPRDPREPIISTAYKKFMGIVFVVSGLAATFVFWGVREITQDLDMARTATFVLIALDSLVFVYVIRGMRQYIVRRDIFDNKYVNYSVLMSFALIVAGLYIPIIARFLGTVPLTGELWLIVASITMIEVAIFETSKGLLFIRKVRIGV
jgi:Ca2+-transporting ATPase